MIDSTRRVRSANQPFLQLFALSRERVDECRIVELGGFWESDLLSNLLERAFGAPEGAPLTETFSAPRAEARGARTFVVRARRTRPHYGALPMVEISVRETSPPSSPSPLLPRAEQVTVARNRREPALSGEALPHLLIVHNSLMSLQAQSEALLAHDDPQVRHIGLELRDQIDRMLAVLRSGEGVSPENV